AAGDDKAQGAELGRETPRQATPRGAGTTAAHQGQLRARQAVQVAAQVKARGRVGDVAEQFGEARVALQQKVLARLRGPVQVTVHRGGQGGAFTLALPVAQR